MEKKSLRYEVQRMADRTYRVIDTTTMQATGDHFNALSDAARFAWFMNDEGWDEADS